MNVKEIKTLVGIMEESTLTAMEIDMPELKVRLERTAGNTVEYVQAPVATPASVAMAQPAAAAAPAAAVEAASPETAYKEIKAPMVGVFYAAASPDADPYVSKGSVVKKGDVVCIIEAMKLMNEINAEEEGQVAEICVQNGQIVEFGQTIMKLL